MLHFALVIEKREALKIWTVLLAILTFSLSLPRTLLVWPGVLTSAHSFATDPSQDLFTSAATVLIGTLYPLMYEAVTGDNKISVGAQFFNLTFGPLMLSLWSTALAHAGLGVTLLGIVMVTAYEAENAAVLKKASRSKSPAMMFAWTASRAISATTSPRKLPVV